ncbi:MAG: tyrosine-type recombinase/integrase [Bacteroidetes bacterium]|nr:tyrosine-type recombinase/integrase [Bacteroidota bacterium]
MTILQLKDNFLEYLQFEKRLSGHTVTSYNTDLDQFIAYLIENYKIETIDGVNHLLIRSWVVSQMEQKISARTINHKITALKTFYKYLLRQGVVTENPMPKIQTPKIAKRLTVFVEKDNMDKLLDNVDFGDDFAGIRNQLMIELFYATGIRLAELVGLKQQNVDMYNCTIKVLGKRNKERVIPFADSLKPRIKKYLAQKAKINNINEEHFFVTEKGNKLYEKLVYRVVNNYLSMVTTIEKRSPHVLRHTFATHMLNNGADLNAIKELLGHSSLAATQVYTHNTVEKLKAVHKQAHPKA